MNMIQIQLNAIGVWTPSQGRALDNQVRREVSGKFWNRVPVGRNGYMEPEV